jgi:hypothetical protein
MRLASLIERGAARMTKLRDTGAPAPGESFPVPSPTMGMNTRDAVDKLDPREARSIENMIVENGRLVIRKGKTEHQEITGASAVGSAFTHRGVSAEVLLMAADGEIYDVTGEPDALTTEGYSLNVWTMAQLDDTTIGVNGTDTPWAFDGSAIGASGLSGSGLTIEDLRTVHVVNKRFWFTQKSSANVWYGGPGSTTGVLTRFNLSEETKGGVCVGIYAYRGSTVFVMSTGETVSYQGDPQIDFAQSGVYDGPKPVGYDPGLPIQGDLVIMTASGPLPFEAIVAGVAFDTVALNNWGKIATSWAEDFTQFGELEGWNALFFKGLILFNIPTDTDTSKQWIFNTRTKAWSFWTGLHGYQFAELGGTLYFGDRGAGQVWSNTGGTDDGDPIVAPVRAGFFIPFGSRNGQYTQARLNLEVSGAVTAQLQIDVDYVSRGISAPEVSISASGSGPWDGPWDEPWGSDGTAQKRWSGVTGFGRAVATVVQFNSSADKLEWFSTDIIGAPAGPI